MTKSVSFATDAGYMAMGQVSKRAQHSAFDDSCTVLMPFMVNKKCLWRQLHVFDALLSGFDDSCTFWIAFRVLLGTKSTGVKRGMGAGGPRARKVFNYIGSLPGGGVGYGGHVGHSAVQVTPFGD